MKILLHICCAPCGIYPIEKLFKESGHQVCGFYFNPNIHPYVEYQKRRFSVEAYFKNTEVEVSCPEYEPSLFFRKVAYNEYRPMRCRNCWTMRLEKTALHARENKFDAFSTTLLISPYQDHLLVKTIGEELAGKFGIDFYYQDFRPGFRSSQEEARRQNLYMQKYCGCLYSEIERFSKKETTQSGALSPEGIKK